MNLTLRKRRLQGIRLENQEFAGLDLGSMSAYGSEWKSCTFSECEMFAADFRTAEFLDCQFRDCELRAANFGSAKLRHVRFERCDMRQSAFAVATPLDQVVFQSCRLQYATFFDSTVRDASFLDTNLHGADLRFIEANKVRFHGSILWGAQVQLGCQFFGGEFDERSADLFTALVARVHPDLEDAAKLREIAGTYNAVAERLMTEQKTA